MKVPSASQATLAMAGISFKRILRSKVIFVALIFAAVPLIPLAVDRGSSSDPIDRFNKVLNTLAYVQLLVASLLCASVIAEEIQDKTYAYLWSRPIARSSVLAGKLLTGILLASGLMMASTLAAAQFTNTLGSSQLPQALLGIFLGVSAAGCTAAAFGTLLPKYPLAFSIAYFLIADLAIGSMPFALAKLSILANTLAIAGLEKFGAVIPGLLWIVGLAVFWISLTVWRLRRAEMSTGS